MTNRSITVEHDGETYDGQYMTIRRTTLGIEDHGILTAWLHLEGGSCGQGFGGRGMDKPNGDRGPRVGSSYGTDYILQILRVVGVDSWEKLSGQQVIALRDKDFPYGAIVGLAHPIEDRVFIAKKHAEDWLAREDGAAL